MEILLAGLARKVTRVALSLGFMSEKFIAHFGNRRHLSMSVTLDFYIIFLYLLQDFSLCSE